MAFNYIMLRLAGISRMEIPQARPVLLETIARYGEEALQPANVQNLVYL